MRRLTWNLIIRRTQPTNKNHNNVLLIYHHDFARKPTPYSWSTPPTGHLATNDNNILNNACPYHTTSKPKHGSLLHNLQPESHKWNPCWPTTRIVAIQSLEWKAQGSLLPLPSPSHNHENSQPTSNSLKTHCHHPTQYYQISGAIPF